MAVNVFRVEMTNGMTPEEDIAEARRTVAQACRVLAHAGLMEDVLGHVSVRVGDDGMLLRCRGPEERGLLFTRAEDVHEVGLDGTGELPDGYRVPHEHPIHGEILRARPEVRAVVHAHPRATVLAELGKLPLRPVFGAYNIPAYRIARAGVPVHPRSVLVSTAALGRELVESMGDADVCVLHGHGVAVTGTSVEQAVVRALALEELSRWAVDLASLDATPDVVPPADQEELPDLGSELNDLSVWRHHLGRLERAGLSLG
jgi:ribulose-5-phosphate 4-epimerase/fuculose-1-phosphate aldolase